METKDKEIETLKSLTARISSNGWDIDTLANQKFVNEAENAEISQMNQKIEKMQQKLEHREAVLARKETLAEFKSFVAANPEEYELILLNNASHKVLELIEHYFHKEKKLLSKEEAAKAIENELLFQAAEEAKKTKNSKKLKELYKEVLPAAKSEAKASAKNEAAKAAEAQTNEDEIRKPLVANVPKMAKLKITPVATGRPIEGHAFVKKSGNVARAELISQIVSNFNQNRN